MHATKRWQGRAEGRRLGAVSGTISSGSRSEMSGWLRVLGVDPAATGPTGYGIVPLTAPDRKSTRLNSSHGYISYAVFCLKKKKEEIYVGILPCCTSGFNSRIVHDV